MTRPVCLVFCVAECLEIVDGRQNATDLLVWAELSQAMSHCKRMLLHIWHWDTLLQPVANRVDVPLEFLFLVSFWSKDLLDPQLKHPTNWLTHEFDSCHGIWTWFCAVRGFLWDLLASSINARGSRDVGDCKLARMINYLFALMWLRNVILVHVAPF